MAILLADLIIFSAVDGCSWLKMEVRRKRHFDRTLSREIDVAPIRDSLHYSSPADQHCEGLFAIAGNKNPVQRDQQF